VNTGAPWPDLDEAEHRVLVMQTKLHQWATADPGRRFDDLANLVYDPAFLAVAWARVRGNKGARTAGVDGVAPRSVVFGAAGLLGGLRDDLKAGRFVPQRVRGKTIPKANGKVRSLGIPTVADRVVQASLKLVLEPIFEADFKPCSYGFRPRRRAQDAIAEIHFLASAPRNYTWVLEADIKACFDEIDHTALMGRVRHRIGDKRVLGLVKAFLKAGVLSEDGTERDTVTGTPQGGILSPLLANIALSGLDEHFAAAWEAMGDSSARHRRRRKGLATYRLVRYADDFVVMCRRESQANEAMQRLRDIFARLRLTLHPEKTKLVQLGLGRDGFDFLGCYLRIVKSHFKGRTYLFRWPSRRAMRSVRAKIRDHTNRRRRAGMKDVDDVIRDLNPVLRGWGNYFKTGNASKQFTAIDYCVWRRITRLLAKLRRKRGASLGSSWARMRREWPMSRLREHGLHKLLGTIRYPGSKTA